MTRIKFEETSSREYTPIETLEKITKMGIIGEKSIVPKILRVDEIDCLNIPVYFSFSKKVLSDEIDYNFTHAGKGVTPEEAKCSAIFEAIERYSAKMNGKETVLLGKQEDFENAIPLEKFIVGENVSLEENLVLEWSEMNVANSDEKKLVPTNYVYFPYRPLNESVNVVMPHDTNGLAAGNTLFEALIHATYEVVEKDAFCIFWNNRYIYQNVDITEFENKNLRAIIEIIYEKGIEFVIKDITTDIGIPTYVAILDCRNIEQPAYVYGSGTHLDPEIAILRALTEAIQLRVSQMILLRYKPELRFKKVSGLGSDSHDIIENMISPEASKLMEPIFKDNADKVSIKKYQRYNYKMLEECFSIIVKKICDAGYEVLYRNLEREEVKIPAVRVIIPGLQPSNGLPSRKSDRLINIPKYIVSNYEIGIK